MGDLDRILMECRYLLSLNKSYYDLSIIFNTDINTVYDDLNNKLPKFDSILYKRVSSVLNIKK